MKKKINIHVKIGDKIKVISGGDRGFIGKIAKVFPKESFAILDGLVPRTKFIKSKEEGQSNTKEIPKRIHLSNLMLWDEDLQKASRIGYKFVNSIDNQNEKKKMRYFKKSGKFIEN